MNLRLLLSLGFGFLVGCGSRVEIEDGGGGEAGSNNGGANPQGGADIGGSNPQGGAPNGPNGPGNGGAPNGPGNGGAPNGPNGPGNGGAPNTTTGEPQCSGFGDMCTECVAEACPADWCGCANSMDCLALFSCTDGCNGDEACNQMCITQHQDGVSAAILVSACAGGPCDASCPQGGDELDPCEECLYQSCDDEMNACLAVPACLDLWDCLKACAQLDLTCQQNCYASFGAGVAPLQAVVDCATAVCDPVCGDN